MPVVAAHELDQLGAARIAARKAQRAHGRFRTGVDHAHHVDAGQGVDDLGGEDDLVLTGGTVACAPVDGGMYGGSHFGVGVAQ